MSLILFLRCPCGAIARAPGYHEDDTNAGGVIDDHLIEWEGGINDDFDPDRDDKTNLCTHDDYEILGSDYDHDDFGDYL